MPSLGNSYVTSGDIVNVNGTDLVWTGSGWDYPYNTLTTGSVNNTWIGGDNMANNTPGLFGDIMFNHEFTYQPYTAVNVKSGKILGKVYEINPNGINGLGSTGSLWAITGPDSKPAFPYYSWSALLEKLQG